MIISCYFTASICGQQTKVEKIEVFGLKRTTSRIVIRDMPTRLGDSFDLKDLPDIIQENKWQLLNTGIYSEMAIIASFLKPDSSAVRLDVYLQEAWFIYPIPYAELVDRNFNVWWREYKHDLSRINAGTKLYINNLTGHRDRLDGLFQFGFHDKIEAEYSLPYINRKNTLGLQISGLWDRTKELGYQTSGENIQLRQLEDGIILRRFRTSAGIVYQPRIRSRHKLRIEYREFYLDTAIMNKLNPQYLNTSSQKLNYPVLAYNYIYDNRNIKPHPTAGYYVEAWLEKQGFSDQRNALIAGVDFRSYHEVLPLVTFAEEIKLQTNLLNKQTDYYHNRALGEADYVRGYEYYLIDGQRFGFLKTSFQWLVYDKKWKLGKIVPIESLRSPQVQVFFNINNDLGYVEQSQGFVPGRFNNKLIWGGGIGVEIIAFYDKAVQLEYSFNQIFENDVFLHINLNF